MKRLALAAITSLVCTAPSAHAQSYEAALQVILERHAKDYTVFEGRSIQARYWQDQRCVLGKNLRRLDNNQVTADTTSTIRLGDIDPGSLKIDWDHVVFRYADPSARFVSFDAVTNTEAVYVHQGFKVSVDQSDLEAVRTALLRLIELCRG